jgi:hypothetical protein
MKSLLRSQRLNVDLPVVPVLMLWGAGSPKLQQPDLIDEVHVVYGPNAKPWVAQWAAGPITQPWPALSRPVFSRSRPAATNTKPLAESVILGIEHAGWRRSRKGLEPLEERQRACWSDLCRDSKQQS